MLETRRPSPSLAQMKPRGPSKCRPLCRFHDTCAELNEIFLNHQLTYVAENASLNQLTVWQAACILQVATRSQ
jgi:hypothetical protein